MDRQKLGLAGLLAFEALIVAYLLGLGAPITDPFLLMYAFGAVALAVAVLWKPTRWLYGILAAVSLYRAYLQTSGGADLGVYPTYLVPLGFAWLAIAPQTMSPQRSEARTRPQTRHARVAIASVAVARTWFIVWYFLGSGLNIVVVANVIGAAGAWLWVAAAEPADGSGTLNDEPRVAPP